MDCGENTRVQEQTSPQPSGWNRGQMWRVFWNFLGRDDRKALYLGLGSSSVMTLAQRFNPSPLHCTIHVQVSLDRTLDPKLPLRLMMCRNVLERLNNALLFSHVLTHCASFTIFTFGPFLISCSRSNLLRSGQLRHARTRVTLPRARAADAGGGVSRTACWPWPWSVKMGSLSPTAVIIPSL